MESCCWIPCCPTNRSAAWEDAAYPPGARLLAIGAPSPLAITWQLFADLQAAQPDAPRLSVATPLPELVEALNAYQPEGLVGYPTVAGQHLCGHRGAAAGLQHPQDPSLKLSEDLEGRRMDTIYLPSRRGGEVALHPLRPRPGLRRPARRTPVPTAARPRRPTRQGRRGRGASPDLPARLRRSLVEAIEAIGAVPPPVGVEQVAALDR